MGDENPSTTQIMSAVEAFPAGIDPFPVVSIYLVSIKNPVPNYRRILSASIVLGATWLTVHINNLAPTLLQDYKRWLFHVAVQSQNETEQKCQQTRLGLTLNAAGGTRRVLHIVDNGGLMGSGINHPFWRLINLISLV